MRSGCFVTLAVVLLGCVATAQAIDPPRNVRVTPFYSTTQIQWARHADPSVKAFNIYRRLAGESYPAQPIRRAIHRDYSDYNLTPGATYFYQVVATDAYGNEISGPSDEVEVTLRSDDAGLSTHKYLDVLIVIYKGGYSDEQVRAYRNGLEEGLRWYWRTTELNLAMLPTWLEIDGYPPANNWYSSAVQNDLRARGVTDHQYDLAYLVGNNLAGCLGGYVVFGSTCAALGTACGVPYPELARDDLNTTIIWTYAHEIHHALEAMENRTGSATPEVLFCHFSDAYPNEIGQSVGWSLPVGPHFGGIAASNRDYGNKWMTFPPPYDGYIECVDEDGDGIPDYDWRVPIRESRSEFLATKVDTDDDGLDDKAELVAADFRGSWGDYPDTDFDGLLDGEDPMPLYACETGIPYATTPPTIDGVFSPGEWQLFCSNYYYSTLDVADNNTYVAWDENALYFAFQYGDRMRAYISLDGSPHLGRWESDVRHVDGDPDTRFNSNDVNNIGDVWADGRYIYAEYDGNSLQVPSRGFINGGEIGSGSADGSYFLEVKIPRQLPGGASHVWYPTGGAAPVVDGLRLSAGRELGINVTLAAYDNANTSEFSGDWTALFELYRFPAFTLLPPRVPGDLNCDGVIDTFDVDPFVLALSSASDYAAAYPACDVMLADLNGDDVIDTFDIDAFIAALSSSAPTAD